MNAKQIASIVAIVSLVVLASSVVGLVIAVNLWVEQTSYRLSTETVTSSEPAKPLFVDSLPIYSDARYYHPDPDKMLVGCTPASPSVSCWINVKFLSPAVVASYLGAGDKFMKWTINYRFHSTSLSGDIRTSTEVTINMGFSRGYNSTITWRDNQLAFTSGDIVGVVVIKFHSVGQGENTLAFGLRTLNLTSRSYTVNSVITGEISGTVEVWEKEPVYTTNTVTLLVAEPHLVQPLVNMIDYLGASFVVSVTLLVSIPFLWVWRNSRELNRT